MSEVWRPIPSAQGYMASDAGRIRSPLGRVIKAHSHLGYKRVSLLQPGDRTKHKRLVHRLVCEAFHGPAPSPGHVAAHWNDVGDDNRPSNLRWATQAENVKDMVRNGVFRPIREVCP